MNLTSNAIIVRNSLFVGAGTIIFGGILHLIAGFGGIQIYSSLGIVVTYFIYGTLGSLASQYAIIALRLPKSEETPTSNF